MWCVCAVATPNEAVDGFARLYKLPERVSEEAQRASWAAGNPIASRRPDLTLVKADCPERLEELMQQCWSDLPSDRPRFEQCASIIKHVEQWLCQNSRFVADEVGSERFKQLEGLVMLSEHAARHVQLQDVANLTYIFSE